MDKIAESIFGASIPTLLVITGLALIALAFLKRIYAGIYIDEKYKWPALIVGFAMLVGGIVYEVYGLGKPSPSPSGQNFIAKFPTNPPVSRREYEPVTVTVYYRLARQTHAERIVGLLLHAKFKEVKHFEDNLNQTVVADRSPGVAWIKSTPAKASLLNEVRTMILNEMRSVIPEQKLGIANITLTDTPADIARRGEIQIQLY